jgi:hypothetical protein
MNTLNTRFGRNSERFRILRWHGWCFVSKFWESIAGWCTNRPLANTGSVNAIISPTGTAAIYMVLSRDRVTVEGFWIDDRIYLTLWYSARLHFTVHCYTNISVHSHVFTAVAWLRLPTADVPLTIGSRPVPVQQLAASKSKASQRLTLSRSLTH